MRPRLSPAFRVGYIEQWMNERPATDVDRAAMDKMRALKMNLQPVTLPDWPYSSLMPVLFAEGAAAFEELALNNQLGTLKAQVKDAWPNLFRQARFLSAVDFVQADRLRRKVALEMARIFREVDVLLVPSLRDEQLTITNFTGHPSLTLRAGFVEVSEARSDWAPDPANPLPTVQPAAARASRHHDRRPVVRRRPDRPRRRGARARVQRRRRSGPRVFRSSAGRASGMIRAGLAGELPAVDDHLPARENGFGDARHLSSFIRVVIHLHVMRLR